MAASHPRHLKSRRLGTPRTGHATPTVRSDTFPRSTALRATRPVSFWLRVFGVSCFLVFGLRDSRAQITRVEDETPNTKHSTPTTLPRTTGPLAIAGTRVSTRRRVASNCFACVRPRHSAGTRLPILHTDELLEGFSRSERARRCERGKQFRSIGPRRRRTGCVTANCVAEFDAGNHRTAGGVSHVDS